VQGLGKIDMVMLRFTKMNGAGNDFVMIDNRAGDVQLSREQIARICDRHRGVGADGILLIENAKNDADFRMRYYNADGGEAEMCGNGARCFARFAKKVANAGEKISFETPAGVIGAQLQGQLVRLTMSDPTELRLNMHLPVDGEDALVHYINSGVPHVIVPVSRVDMVHVRERGASIRQHEKFSPKGANVNFVEKRDKRKIAIRTYERGVEDETLACGTGVVASALIFATTENVDGPIKVHVRGGSELEVDFDKIDNGAGGSRATWTGKPVRVDEPGGESINRFRNVTLTGPAEFVFEGEIEI
jgi:diaminopimelate epimerase